MTKSKQGDVREVVIETLSRVPQKPINEVHRFFIVALCTFGCICPAFTYAFNLISKPMQNRYDFSQDQMSTIVTVGLFFKYFLMPYSYIFDYFGPIPVTVIMTTYFTIGSICLAQCFSGGIEGSVVRLSIFLAFLNCGASLFDVVCCMTAMSYFPTKKGYVTSVMKPFTGLGSAIVGSIYLAFFNKRTDLYFYFLMSYVIVVGIAFLAFLRFPPYQLTLYERRKLSPERLAKRKATKAPYLKQDPPLVRFVYGFIIMFSLMVYLPVESTLVTFLNLGSSYQVAFAVIASVVTLSFALIAIPFPGLNGPKTAHTDSECLPSANEGLNRSDELTDEAHKDTVKSYEPISDVPQRSLQSDAPEVALSVPELDVDYVAPQYAHSFQSNLRMPELWALWWTSFCIIGSEFVIIFNANYIYTAFAGEEPSDALRTLLTVINGSCSGLGRLLTSFFEMWSQSGKPENRVPITASLFIPIILAIISFVLLLALPNQALLLPFALISLSNGYTFTTLVLTTRTIFARDQAKHYHFCFTAISFAAVFLNSLLYGKWYTKQANKRGTSKLCYDKECVLMPVLVLCVLSISALLSAVFLHFRYRKFCQCMMKERARIHEETTNKISG